MIKDAEFEEFVKLIDACGQAYWHDYPARTSQWIRGLFLSDHLFTLGNFQVERTWFSPYGGTPMHRHPLVDSYEFPLWGSGDIVIGRHKFKLNEKTTPWKPLYISHDTWHGGYGHERGGGFLSVQCWNGEISGSIGTNWEAK